MNRANFFLSAAVLVGLSLSAPAFADPGKGKGKEAKGGHHEVQKEHHGDDSIVIRFGSNDRDIIRNHLRKDYQRNCPPGLAKKHNGCLPPGQAKKYAVGDVFSPDVIFRDIPRDLLALLNPAPRGYKYVEVDRDIYLIGEASKKIIDAVTLLSAVE